MIKNTQVRYEYNTNRLYGKQWIIQRYRMKIKHKFLRTTWKKGKDYK